MASECVPNPNLKGFHSGPKCKVCQKEWADKDETICFRCKAVFNRADYAACSSTGIRIDMVEEDLMRMWSRDYDPRHKRGGYGGWE